MAASCHLRAIHGGHWRRLAVIHGYSGHADLRWLLYRRATARMVRMGSRQLALAKPRRPIRLPVAAEFRRAALGR